jgi:hypothetical protein
MPILAEHRGQKYRRMPLWVGAIVLVLLPVGLFGWTLGRPIVIPVGSRELRFGLNRGAHYLPPGVRRLSWSWVLHFPLPLPLGGYAVSYQSQVRVYPAAK